MNKKTQVKRAPKRGIYDKETIYEILDNNYLCHVAFVHEGYPVVIPTAYGRSGNDIYIHGATASRMMKNLQEGLQCSISIAKVNSLVLAKSAFHHSMNYESVVIFGKALIVDEMNKNNALKIMSDHMIPGRWEEVRLPNQKELKATVVLKIALDEVSAKRREGPPIDDKADEMLPIWSGLIKLVDKYEILPDDRTKKNPASITNVLQNK